MKSLDHDKLFLDQALVHWFIHVCCMADSTLLHFVSVHHIYNRVSDRFGVSAVPDQFMGILFILTEWEMFPFEAENTNSLSFSSLPL